MCKLSSMIHSKSIHKYFFTIIISLTFGFGQFIEVNVDLDMRRLSEGDRQIFHSMEELMLAALLLFCHN